MSRDATRRTHLANERTQLAWWRTGLTAVAVSLAIGRVVPEIGRASVHWPYSVVGGGFAIYGVMLILYGNTRSRRVTSGLQIGRFSAAPSGAITALTAAGAVLGAATFLLIIVDS
jgi:putative membrane protein